MVESVDLVSTWVSHSQLKLGWGMFTKQIDSGCTQGRSLNNYKCLDRKLICHLGNKQVNINNTCLTRKVNEGIKEKIHIFNPIGS